MISVEFVFKRGNYLHIQSHFEVLGIRTSMYKFGEGDTILPTRGGKNTI